MEKFLIRIFYFLILISISCKKEDNFLEKRYLVEEIEDIINNKDIFLIDTREIIETTSIGYIKNSILIDETHNYNSFLSKLIKKDSKIILITHEGKEKSILRITKKLGYKNILGYFYLEDWLKNAKELLKINMVKASHISNILNDTDNIIIDVREENEYSHDGIIKNSLLIPYSRFNTEYIKIKKDKNIYFLCKIGYRAITAITYIQRLGYKNNLYNIDGGMINIKKTGFKLQNYSRDL